MRTMYITKGLPASGKSTWAKQLLKKEPGRWKRINNDDIRIMLDDYVFTKENESFVGDVRESLVRQALNKGYDVIVDNTHLSAQALRKLHSLAESIGDIKVIEKAFNVSVDIAFARNSLREGHAKVPEDVIRGMAKKAGLDKGNKLNDIEVYYPPKSVGVYERDESLPKAIMCDLDGTLAIIGDRSPYDASRCDVVDHPNWPVINTVLAMHSRGYNVVFMSGRDSKYRDQTVRFIEKWVKVNNKPISYKLYMRPLNDCRKDSIVKEELFNEHVRGKYDVEFVLDDRDSVCVCWRRMGLTCFQVNWGQF